MSDKQTKQKVAVKVIAPINKAQSFVQKGSEELEPIGFLANEIAPPYDPQLLEELTRQSTIIPQCKRSYKNNIAGFGIGVQFKRKEYKSDPTPEMEKEVEELEDLLENISFEKQLKKVFENIIDKREELGYAFLEVISNTAIANEPYNIVEVKEIEEPRTIKLLKQDKMPTEYSVIRNGRKITKTKRFRRFKQVVHGQTIYFKEWGDPRKIDMYSGEYGEDIPIIRQGNALLHFKIGYSVYGTPRWEGPMLSVQGARMAEKLNWKYFKKGRHIPLAILVNNGTLTEDSEKKLQEYMNQIEGENGQHGFVIIEAEAFETDTAMQEKPTADVELKSLVDILQKDELFQEYMENVRRKVQSSFLLPDIYTGYSQDYNVATAKEITKKTEEQVFIPEREDLKWIVNNILLMGYDFKYVEAYFKSPNVENTDHQVRMFMAARDSFSVNQSLEEYYTSVNKDFTPLQEDWANIPLSIINQQTQASLVNQMDGVIAKAQNNNENDDIIGVLKSVKKALTEINRNIK